MKPLTLPCLLALAAIGCGPSAQTEAFLADVDRVTALSVRTGTLGVPSGSGFCGGRSQRYDLERHTLTVTECAPPRIIAARPADSAALRAALRSVVVEARQCLGYDGTVTGVTFEFEAGAIPAEYALGWVSCSGGPPASRTITLASWDQARTILERVANGA